MTGFLRELWERDEAQDVAEYAVMLAVILAIAVATIRLVGSHGRQCVRECRQRNSITHMAIKVGTLDRPI